MLFSAFGGGWEWETEVAGRTASEAREFEEIQGRGTHKPKSWTKGLLNYNILCLSVCAFYFYFCYFFHIQSASRFIYLFAKMSHIFASLIK